MLQRILETDNSTSSLILRLALGIVMFPHGAQKLLGWFGGYGFSGTIGFFTETLGIPALFAFLVIIAEFFGALALIVGLLTRIAALGVGVVMAVAATLHVSNGFFMNWTGQQQGEGYEYHLLALGITVAIVLNGAGRCSVDRALVTNADSST